MSPDQRSEDYFHQTASIDDPLNKQKACDLKKQTPLGVIKGFKRYFNLADKFKTEMCRNWEETGRCQFGDAVSLLTL
jgi:hypothetical protein